MSRRKLPYGKYSSAELEVQLIGNIQHIVTFILAHYGSMGELRPGLLFQ